MTNGICKPRDMILKAIFYLPYIVVTSLTNLLSCGTSVLLRCLLEIMHGMAPEAFLHQ
jgi:hypothetical protein